MAKAVKRKRSAVRPTGALQRMLRAAASAAVGLRAWSSEDATSAEPDLSGGAIDERVEHSRAELITSSRSTWATSPSSTRSPTRLRAMESIVDGGRRGRRGNARRQGFWLALRSSSGPTVHARPSWCATASRIASTSPIGTWGETLDDSARAARRHRVHRPYRRSEGGAGISGHRHPGAARIS